MDESARELVLRRYEDAWRSYSLVPTVLAYPIWLCALWFSSSKPVDLGPLHLSAGMAVRALSAFSPIVAWTIGLRRLRSAEPPAPPAAERLATPSPPRDPRETAAGTSGSAVYRKGAPRAGAPREAWYVTSPFPRWTLAMFFCTLLLDGSWWWLAGLGERSAKALGGSGALPLGPSVFLGLIGLIAGMLPATLAFACHLWIWARWWRRDARGAGVLVRRKLDDGSPGMALYTLAGVRRLPIVALRRSSHTLGLADIEVWHAVHPLDDLVEIDPVRAA